MVLTAKKKNNICKFLIAMESEEDIAKATYARAKRQFPKEASKLESVLGDKLKHAKTFGRLIKKYRC